MHDVLKDRHSDHLTGEGRTPLSFLAASISAGAIALASFAVLHVRGIGLNPDSWAYWEGAVSLCAGRGYTYFSGARIVEWPPLCSVYLAGWLMLRYARPEFDPGLVGECLLLRWLLCEGAHRRQNNANCQDKSFHGRNGGCLIERLDVHMKTSTFRRRKGR